MKIELWACLVTSSVLALSPAHATKYQVTGFVSYDDGSPIKSGTVIFTEIPWKPGKMPEKVRILTRTTTSLKGEFSASIDGLSGDLHVEIIADHCDWLGNSNVVPEVEFKKGKRHVELRTKRDEKCSQ